MDATHPCPCGSDQPYGDCCLPFHQGTLAPTAVALMRSRYSAFALENADYLSATWHPQTRPQNLTFEPDTRWLKLEVLDHTENTDSATVSFVATFREQQAWFRLSEKSRFVREGECWYYLEGDASFDPFKPGRNDVCPCGSGKKFKKCCG